MPQIPISAHRKDDLVALATDAARVAFSAAFEAMDSIEEAVRVSDNHSESDVLFLNTNSVALKQALESVNQHLNRLQEELRDELDPVDRGQFSALVDSMSVALAAIGDLSTFNEVSGRESDERESLAHLPESIRTVLSRLAPLFGQGEMMLSTVFTPEPQKVNVKSRLLENILINMLLHVLRQDQHGNLSIIVDQPTTGFASCTLLGEAFDEIRGIEVPPELPLNGRVAFHIRKGFSYGMAIALEYMVQLGGEMQPVLHENSTGLKLMWPLVR